MPASRIKKFKRALRKNAMEFRAGLAARTPEPIRRAAAPVVNYTDVLLFDHLFIRILFPNRHKLSANAWRAAQPLPYQLKRVKALGIRTVVNLRGNATETTAKLERAACDRLGLAYVDFCLRSRDAPRKAELQGLRQIFETAEPPILLHCKSGADRAGLASVLYLHFVENVPIEEARHQLSARFGHVRYADTGVLDAFFESYLAFAARQPISFAEWLDHHYDPAELKRSFRSNRWADRLVNGVLRRE